MHASTKLEAQIEWRKKSSEISCLVHQLHRVSSVAAALKAQANLMKEERRSDRTAFVFSEYIEEIERAREREVINGSSC